MFPGRRGGQGGHGERDEPLLTVKGSAEVMAVGAGGKEGGSARRQDVARSLSREGWSATVAQRGQRSWREREGLRPRLALRSR